MKFLLNSITIIYLALIIPGFYMPGNKESIHIQIDKKDKILNTVILEEFQNEFFNESSKIKSKSENENLDFELTLSTPKLFRFFSPPHLPKNKTAISIFLVLAIVALASFFYYQLVWQKQKQQTLLLQQNELNNHTPKYLSELEKNLNKKDVKSRQKLEARKRIDELLEQKRLRQLLDDWDLNDDA